MQKLFFTEIVQVPVQTIGQLQKVAIVPQSTGPVKKVSEIIQQFANFDN